MVRGAGWREPNLRLRRREKNVLDMPLYRSDVLTSLRRLFARQAKGKRKLVLRGFHANNRDISVGAGLWNISDFV